MQRRHLRKSAASTPLLLRQSRGDPLLLRPPTHVLYEVSAVGAELMKLGPFGAPTLGEPFFGDSKVRSNLLPGPVGAGRKVTGGCICSR